MIPSRRLPPSSSAPGTRPDVLRYQQAAAAGPGPSVGRKGGTGPLDTSSTATMDVFLIPTSTSEQYELYYEAADEDPTEEAEGRGLFQRWRRRFSEALREAEEWRHKRHEDEPPATGLLGRGRRRIMSFIVERIAEQRLLWHLRRASEVCAQVPADLFEADAERIIRAALKRDGDHHFRWMWIDLALLVLVAPLTIIPGPNLPGFYFTFQVVGHYLSMRGARRGLSEVRWSIRQNAALSELRALLVLSTPQRSHRIHELAARLRLQHLATFFEQVAAPTT
jgi:Mitochondrial K+-H+ exchange-related